MEHAMRTRLWKIWLVGLAIALAGCNLGDDAASGPHSDASNDAAGDAEGETSGPLACDVGTACDGICVDLASNPEHCGECDRPCQATNAVSDGCDSGTCQLTCETGFVDENGDLGQADGDGCEVACEPSEDGVEICDGEDNDCDGETDEGVMRTWHFDGDSDGFGQDVDVKEQCDRPSPRYVEVGGDCDDSEATINPDADEVCNEVDNDCDGEIDEGVQTPFYLDSDGDGFGADSTETLACSAPEDHVDQGGDCDDTNSDVRPDQEGFFTQARASGGFDYDCSGAEEKEIDQTSSVGCQYIGLCGRSYSQCAPHADAAGWINSVPDCGESGQIFSGCNSCVYTSGNCTSAAQYANRIQGCR